MAQQELKSGQDVTDLMNLQSGTDVTSLMNLESGQDVTALMNQPEVEAEQEEPSFLTSMYEKAFTPPEFMSRGYDWLREHPEIARNISPLAAIEIPWGEETYKPGLALTEAMSTPGDVALMAGTGGAGIIPKVGRVAQKLAAGLLTTRGGERMITAEDPTEFGVGALETAGGVFGMRGPRVRGRTPQVIPDELPKSEVFQRFDKPGAAPSVDKPHGLYVSPKDIQSPHVEPGDVKTLWTRDLDANILDLSDSSPIPLRSMSIDSGAGVHALRRTVGEKEFNRLRNLSKSELASELKKYDVDITYYDKQEQLEALGAIHARKAGYDGIHFPDASDSRFTEYVGLTRKGLRQVDESSVAGEVLVDALKRQTVLNKQQQRIAASETARRFGEAGEVTTRGTAGAKEFMSKLAGKHPRLVTTPLDLNTNQMNKLHTVILDAPLPETSKAKAIAGLSTIREGGQAMPSEVAVLDGLFGSGVGKAIRDKGIGRTRNRILETLGLAKALKSTADVSWMLRQGALHFMRPYWRRAFIPQLRALADNGYFEKVNQGILRSARNIDYKKKVGLNYTDLKTFEGREEEIMNTWIENIPSIPSLLKAGMFRDPSKLKPGLISKVARASNRSFTLAGNLVRDGSFDVIYDDYARYYRSSKKIAEAIPNERLRVKALREAELFNPDNPYRGKIIADEANVSTARGGLGKAEAFATELNTGLWSVRLLTSRVRSINRVLNPISYIRQDPVMRKEHLKQLFSLIGLTTTTAGLAKIMGGEISFDPRSSDFLKGRIGRTRFDLLGGIPQYVVPVVKAALNQGVSTRTGRPYTLGEGLSDDAIITLVKALMYKEAPLPGFFTSLIRREDPIGRPLNLTSPNPYENIALNTFVPMISEDLFELIKEDPSLIPILMPLAASGASIQVHEER